MEKQKFYITTAIAYASRKPHVGNAYDIVLADMIARYKRARGFDVHFLTGSDEHGIKIEQIATENGISPKEWVDRVAAEIKAVWDCLDVTYDRFIRTTDADHEAAVKKIFKKLYEQGDIYKSEYEGKYCVQCESFFTPSQLHDGKCPDCGRDVVDTKEEAYFLRLSKYQDRLVEYYESHPDFFLPGSRKAEMVNNFIKPGLTDLCVSRTSFKWGIPVDFDDRHVIYVWIDALSNYITGLGYDPDQPGELYKKYWPADLHVIGKDIVRFHTIYWPIILMALGEPLPRQVLGHPWVLFGEEKMSKSRGNVIYSDDLVRRFGSDTVRYYLLSEVPFAQDGSITYEAFIAKYNTDLANTLGNLVNRTIAMTNKYFGGKVSRPAADFDDFDADLRRTAAETVSRYFQLMDNYRNADACAAVMELARRCNKYIDETMPWALAKDEARKPRLEAVLYNLLEGIRLLAGLLEPFMPKCTAKIHEQLACAESSDRFGAVGGYAVGEGSPLFARIDAEKTLAEIEAEHIAARNAAQPAQPAREQLPDISYDDFMKGELRAVRILACEKVPKADKLLQLRVFDGERERTVVSGIAKYYAPEQLTGKKVAMVLNLAPATIRGIRSEGMILSSELPDGGASVVFLDDAVPEGCRIR